MGMITVYNHSFCYLNVPATNYKNKNIKERFDFQSKASTVLFILQKENKLLSKNTCTVPCWMVEHVKH